MKLRRQSGLRIALAAVFCLLFQQLALAAYDCPGAGSDDPAALCASHCAPDSPVSTDPGKSPAPAAVQAFRASFPVADTPVFQVATHFELPGSAADPPPRLRYCSLLI